MKNFNELLLIHIKVVLMNMDMLIRYYEVPKNDKTNMVLSSIFLFCPPSNISAKYIDQILNDKSINELCNVASEMDIDLKSVLNSIRDMFNGYPNIQ